MKKMMTTTLLTFMFVQFSKSLKASSTPGSFVAISSSPTAVYASQYIFFVISACVSSSFCRISITKIKSSGESGHPCLMPLVIRISSPLSRPSRRVATLLADSDRSGGCIPTGVSCAQCEQLVAFRPNICPLTDN